MDNILTYMKWRGDLTLKEAPFNEIDALILSEMVYIRLDEIAPGIREGEITIREAAEKYEITDGRKFFYYAQKEELFLEMAKSRRFGDLKIGNYVSVTDVGQQTQFAAMQVVLAPRTYFVVYRGTDESIVGWREDFNMSYMIPVPAQKSAVEYLESIATDRQGTYYLGGHSKGGNLAIYAGVFCAPKYQKRIGKIYSFDGPGFQSNTVPQEAYQTVEDRIESYVPISSIVGILMEHQENYKVVQSKGIPLRQHEGLTWQLDGPTFALAEETTGFSQSFSVTVMEWMQQVPPTDRMDMVNSVFDAFEEVGIYSVMELLEMDVRQAAALLRAVSKASIEHRELTMKFVKMLIQEGRKFLPQNNKTKGNKTKSEKEKSGKKRIR